jgi:ferredoxin
MSERLSLDPIRCDGHGVCAELFPEGITLDDWGYPILDPQPLSREHLDHARRAVFACPALALKIVKAR